MTETRDPWATSLTRKKFQSLNTFLQSYDYTIMLNKKKKRIIISFVKALLHVSPLGKGCDPSVEQATIPFTQ